MFVFTSKWKLLEFKCILVCIMKFLKKHWHRQIHTRPQSKFFYRIFFLQHLSHWLSSLVGIKYSICPNERKKLLHYIWVWYSANFAFLNLEVKLGYMRSCSFALRFQRPPIIIKGNSTHRSIKWLLRAEVSYMTVTRILIFVLPVSFFWFDFLCF